jgi:hypothetical protein
MCVRGSRTTLASLVLLLTSLAACNRSDQEIKMYRLAKPSGDSSATLTDSATSVDPPAKSNVDHGANPMTNLPAPPNWEPQPLAQMRQASFLVHGDNGAVADISFVSLGPAAGNLLDNVNRWLGQLSQPPITQEKLASMVQELPSPRGKIAVVDLTGTPENGDAKKDGRIVAVVAPRATDTAFYKMRGNSVLVGAEKDNFLKWVTSSHEPNLPPGTVDSESAKADADIPALKWDVPADWLSGATTPMRYASFVAEKNNEKADISVVTFPGDGGSDVDNVNRWRQQIGLSAVEATSLNSMIVPVAGNGTSFSTVDFAGATARTIAGWARLGGRTWFFKISGSTKAVEREKPNFVKFIQSVRF